MNKRKQGNKRQMIIANVKGSVKPDIFKVAVEGCCAAAANFIASKTVKDAATKLITAFENELTVELIGDQGKANVIVDETGQVGIYANHGLEFLILHFKPGEHHIDVAYMHHPDLSKNNHLDLARELLGLAAGSTGERVQLSVQWIQKEK